MSHILCQWINNDVGVSHAVEASEIDEVFRGGFLVAELLQHHRLVDNLGAFQQSFSVDGAVKNFTLLEPALRSIGVPFTSNMAYDVITGKEGAAAQLLYQIKSGLVTSSSVKFDKKGVSHAAQQLETLPKYVLESSGKKHFVEKEHEYFADRLKAKFRCKLSAGPSSSVASKKVKTLTSIVPPSVSVSRSPSRGVPVKPASTSHSLKTTAVLGARSSKMSSTDARERGQSAVEQAARISAQQSEVQRLKQETKRAEQDLKKKSAMEHMKKEVQSFEKHLHVKPSTKHSGATDSKEIKRQIKDSALDSDAHTRVMQKKLPATEVSDRQSQQYLQKIRAKRLEEEASRKEREQRRRKILLGQQKAQEEFEKAQRENILLEKLTKQSKQERRIAEQLLEMKNEKELIRQNRIFLEQQHQERRQKDFDEALQREAILGKQLRTDYQRQAEELKVQYADIVQKKKELRRDKVTVACHEITNQIVDMSVNMIHQLEINDGVIPPRSIEQWKLLFVRGNPLGLDYTISLDRERAIAQLADSDDETETTKDGPIATSEEKVDNEPVAAVSSAEPPAPANVLSVIDAIDEQEFANYLGNKNSWSGGNSGEEEKNAVLSKVVDGLFEVMSKQEVKVHTTTLSKFPLKLMFLGKRFSGKHSIAVKLAEYCSLKVIEVDQAVQEAISASKEQESTQDDKGKPVLTNRAYLGGKAQEALVKGLEISEEITGAIVADAIRTMNAKIALDPSTAQGWVLVDYPKTRAQAALLERELSGYEEPKAQKLGNLKRNQNSAKPNQRTLIAQPANGEQSAASMAESIIDAVFVLDVENAVAIRRAVGRRQDPITGRVFHLEFDPPSAEEPGLVERLVPLDSENDNDNQLQEHLVAYEEEHAGVKSWFTKFGNMHFVDANSTKDDTLTSVELVVSQVIEERKSKLASRPQSVANSTDAKPSSTDFAADAAKPTAERPSSPTTTASDASAQKTPAGTASTPTLTRASRSASTSKPNSARIKRLNITRSAFAGLPTPGITKELATILYNKWITVESTYTNGLKFVFRSLRREREGATCHFFETKSTFEQYLMRPDKKQAMVDVFVKEFNALEEDLRCDAEAKAELHQRAEDFREKLWTISDERKDEAENERTVLIENRWVEDHLALIANLYIGAMQLEVDRYIATKQVLVDFVKDASEVVLDDTVFSSVKVPVVDLTHTENLFQDIARPKHEAPTVLLPANILRKAGQPIKRDRVGTAQKKTSATISEKNEPLSDAPASTIVAPVVLASTIVAPGVTSIEGDAYYHALTNASNAALAVVGEVDFTVTSDAAAPAAAKETKDKKGKVIIEVPAEVKELNAELLAEVKDGLLSENTILRLRVERLREHAYQHLKELKCKAHLVYSQLDEWIGMKFHGEMDAIRELVNIIKDAVELEQRLPNELVLENDAIFVNTEILTYEPEPQPRPQSAVEAKSSDKFTVFQLLNLTMQLRELAPQGVISTKEFKDLIRRMALANCELLPESIQSYDVGQVHTVWLAACAQVRMVLYEPLHHLPTQLVQTLDPIQAGLIFWHDALVRLAQLQPIDLASLLRVKESFQEADKTDSGKVDWASFSTIKLWFEENDDGRSGSASSSSTFDRSQKLKEALFYMFADAQPATGSTTNSALRWLKEHERVPTENLCFNYRHFLLNASLDSDASLGAEKAFSAVSHREDNSVTRQELEQIYHLDVAGAATAVLPLSAVDDLFVQLGEGEQTVTFSQWKRFLEGRQTAFLDCPYFQLKE